MKNYLLYCVATVAKIRQKHRVRRHVRRARGGGRCGGGGRCREGHRRTAGSPGDCIRFGMLTQALPSSIRVIMQALAFTLNNTYAALHKPVLFRKAPGFWNLLGAHCWAVSSQDF